MMNVILPPQTQADDPDSPELSLKLHPRSILIWSISFITILVFISSIGRMALWFLIPQESHFRSFVIMFDVNLEGTVPAYISSILLLICSIIILCIAKSEVGNRLVNYRKWCFLSIVFFYLSIDEMIEIHGRVSEPLRGLGATGIFHYAWVIPAAALLGFMSIAYWPFLMRLPRITRRLFFLSATLFVSGSLMLEMVAGYIYHKVPEGTLKRWVLDAATEHSEEWLEMTGVIIFIYALLTYIERTRGELSFRIQFRTSAFGK